MFYAENKVRNDKKSNEEAAAAQRRSTSPLGKSVCNSVKCFDKFTGNGKNW